MRRNPHRPPRGFTLVEVLIATVLTALVMLTLGSALFGIGKAATSVEAGLERAETLRLVPAFLRTALGGVADSARFEGEAWRAAGFQGGREASAWIGTLPGRHGTGGLHHLRLAVERRGAQPVLVLRYRPYTAPGTRVRWGEAAAHPVLRAVDRFAVAYKAPSHDAWNRHPEWLDAWPHTDQLPEAVRFSITVEGRAWPPLVVPVIPLPAEADDSEALTDEPPA